MATGRLNPAGDRINLATIRRELFAATRATQFPSPVGAVSSTERGIYAASTHANQRASKSFNTLIRSHAEAT